jgi:hypothetical protein
MNLGAARSVRLDQFLAEKATTARPCLGGLLAEGHNGLLAAQYKAGKSTVCDAIVTALANGTPFLGAFDVPQPQRVVYLDYEMTEDDHRDRLRHLDLARPEAVLIVPLRGVRLSLTTAAGRRWLLDQLIPHQPDFIIVDTYSAASAPSVDNENDNAAGRRWLMEWDAIKAEAGAHTSLITHHTGRAQQAEGEEHGRGATVLDDWADTRLMLTRDRESGQRFLASEGRSPYQLSESMLTFDAGTRSLYLAEASIGANRAQARAVKNAQVVADAVAKTPGILTTKLRDAIGDTGISNNAAKAGAIDAAKRRGLVHTHAGAGNRAGTTPARSMPTPTHAPTTPISPGTTSDPAQACPGLPRTCPGAPRAGC